MDIRLKSINYKEFQNDPKHNSWELKDLLLTRQNLIVGKNAVGKTRVVSLIISLTKIIRDPAFVLKNGEWDICFKTTENKDFIYQVNLIDGKVKSEKIVLDGVEKLDRNSSSTKIYSEVKPGFINIEPPDDKLVLHIRRDKKEHPFLEYLYEWALHVNGYRFGKFDPSSVVVPGGVINLLDSLDTVPFVMEKLSKASVEKVLKDFNSIGYEIESAKLGPVQGLPLKVKLIFFREKGIKHPILQTQISSGMFRAFALLVILRYLSEEAKDVASTILIDDLCEGLDYDRSTQFAKLIFEKTDLKNVQLIATTNDRFLMNVVDIKNWNLLVRDKNIISSLNYSNSKKVFDEFKLTGLSNFDLFSSDYLAENGKQNT